MRRYAALILALVLLLSACGRRAAEPPPEEPDPAVEPSEPDEPAEPDPIEIPEELKRRQQPLEDLLAGLERYLAEGEGTPAQKLERLFAYWGLASDEMRQTHLEADLDGDGRPEVVTALNGAGELTGLGALLVIYGEDGEVRIDRGETLPGVLLFTVADLTGDGWPDIIWHSTSMGAHTASTNVYVSSWAPGALTVLPGEMYSTNVERLALEGSDILVTGGTISSAGAGVAQRVRTDRYRWQDGAFALVDRRYAPSDLGYHRLQDGIAAETFGRLADAEAAYREAAEESRQTLLPGGVPDELARDFDHAVRTFARFRLGALLLQAGASPAPAQEGASGPFAGLLTRAAAGADRDAYCRAGAEWAGENPGFLEALNSPYGYANPQWTPADLCGPIPPAP